MVALLVCAAFRGLSGQPAAPPLRVPLPVDVASVTAASVDQENLLLLQLVGCVAQTNIAMRPLSVELLNAVLSSKGVRRCSTGGSRTVTPNGFTPSTPVARSVFNSGAPTDNPGAIWTGKGMTFSGTAGAVARFGVISIAARPVAFWAQNAAFTEPLDTTPDFRNPAYPDAIDLPWRFGDKPYARADWGESWVQVDTREVVAGISTATEEWGPMHLYPLLLGPNAGGFPHVLVGSGLPWNVGIGRLSARMIVGRLDQSAFAPAHAGRSQRLGSGLVASFVPSFFTNLEIGGGRFFHRRWPEDGVNLGTLTIPFEGFLKRRLDKPEQGAGADNQLASAFARLSFPAAGFEVYGEFLRDDHNYDLRDLVSEPDHESAFAVGLRKAWLDEGSGTVTSLMLESVNARISNLAEVRGEFAMYVHNPVPEGHTQRGKLLGSPAAFGGSGQAIVFDRKGERTGWRAALRSEHTAQNFGGGSFNGRQVGFTAIELTGNWHGARGDLYLGGVARMNWDSTQGPNNVSLVFEVRPRW